MGDIAMGTVDVLHTLTEPDTLLEVEELDKFIDALLEAQIAELLMEVLNRMDEAKSEEDGACVTNVLGVVENLVEVKPEIVKNSSRCPSFSHGFLKDYEHKGLLRIIKFTRPKSSASSSKSPPRPARRRGE